MTRLSQDSLRSLPGSVSRPGYDRTAVRSGVVHFGPGPSIVPIRPPLSIHCFAKIPAGA